MFRDPVQMRCWKINLTLRLNLLTGYVQCSNLQWFWTDILISHLCWCFFKPWTVFSCPLVISLKHSTPFAMCSLINSLKSIPAILLPAFGSSPVVPPCTYTLQLCMLDCCVHCEQCWMFPYFTECVFESCVSYSESSYDNFFPPLSAPYLTIFDLIL